MPCKRRSGLSGPIGINSKLLITLVTYLIKKQEAEFGGAVGELVWDQI